MLYFTIETRHQDGIGKVTEAAGARWRFYPRISSDIVGLSSDIVESSFYWRKHFREFPMKSWASSFRGRRSIWWGWRVALLAPRIGNEVSYVTQIIDDIHLRGRRSIWWGWRVALLAPRIGNEVAYVTQIIDDIHFAWQAQYLVRLEGDFTCYTHWKCGFICDADHWWHSFCVAGAVFGEVGGWLYLLRALEMRFHMWRRSLMTFILRGRRSSWWGWRVTSLAPRIGNEVSYVTQIIDDIHLRGRRSIWWGWRVTSLAPRIGNAVSYVTQIIDDIHFAWQAQYLCNSREDNCVFFGPHSSFPFTSAQKPAGSLENSQSIYIFGILNLTCYFPYDPGWVGQTCFCWRTIAPFFGLHSSLQNSDMPKKTALLAVQNCGEWS